MDFSNYVYPNRIGTKTQRGFVRQFLSSRSFLKDCALTLRNPSVKNSLSVIGTQFFPTNLGLLLEAHHFYANIEKVEAID